ncbi:MAG: beta-eliminating lyase-related protein [Coriobacteriia bacterium]|nr:beta-eliminating lyase-related protein [Coriobacteriia bacterium]
MKVFGSDNYSSVHPAVLEQLAQVNSGHAVAYGDDPVTAEAVEVLRRHVGPDTDIRFCFNGTGSNIVGLSALLAPWDAVVCAANAHINTDECGAAEHMAGIKLYPVLAPADGKLTPELIAPVLDANLGFEHARQPKVVSISNATEFGTVYTPDELRALCDYAHSRGLLVHCDGARLANAAAALDVPIAAITSEVGLDALTFGGTKNALMGAEAVVIFNTRHHSGLWQTRKQNAQLASKMRFVAAQFTALYSGDLWRECAAGANAMAARFVAGLGQLGVTPVYSPDANEIFAVLPDAVRMPLIERFHFYPWDSIPGGVRWVCSWDTTADEVDDFLAALEEALDGLSD